MKSFSIDKISFIGFLFIIVGSLLIGLRLLHLVDVSFLTFGILIGIVGFIMLTYPNIQTPSKETQDLIKESLLNIDAILESFDASAHCIYLPQQAGQLYMYIPLSQNVSPSEAWSAMKTPPKLVTEVENKPGLILFTPFSFITKYLNNSLNIGEQLSNILVDRFELMDSIRQNESSGEIILEMSHPLIKLQLPRCEKVLGSFSSYISGCILSANLNRPVTLVNEEFNGPLLRSRFKVLELE